LLESVLATAHRTESQIHAYLTIDQDGAMKTATGPTPSLAAGVDRGPLHGIPIALKDNMCTRGIETTASSQILSGYLPPYDATVVTRLREAGAVIVGKTNLDEFAMGSSTENSAYGPLQPLGHRPGAGRVFGRIGGGRRRRVGPGGTRLRHRWLDPPAGGIDRESSGSSRPTGR
jgi:aspartyl-tRNA(Asn)/glutamyl-tRNA(Gln) amidotransferase subunit A